MINLVLALGLIPVLLVLRRFYHSHFAPTFLEKPEGGVPRPPLVADWVPFVGNALSMTRGDAFWAGVIRRYGPVVRVRAMGEVRTFVTTPGAISLIKQLISYVYKNSRNFDFLHFRRSMSSQIFGQNANHAQSDAMDAIIFPGHHKNMQPGSIADLIRKYADHLEGGLKQAVEAVGDEGKVVDLGDHMFDILYESSAKAFFTPSFPAAAFKPSFMAFDAAFPLLNLAALPAIARRPAEKARDEALRIIEEWWVDISDEDRQQLAPSMLGMVEASEAEGWPLRDIAAFFLSEIWALEANAPYAGIWAVVELLRNPSALTRLRTEITDVIATLSPPTLSTLLHKPQPELPGLLPYTNAVFQETLRYHVDTLSLRVVQSDCVIPPNLLSGGIGAETGLRLHKGEQVICATRVPMVNEEEWGADAGKWNPERFMKGGAAGRSMNPFGGGVSMCEGRHFASAEILTFIAAFTHLFDADILSDTMKANPQRIGLGVQQPMGGVTVRLRRRADGYPRGSQPSAR